ncbi:uncharacterized protein [Epargyreus clarus]|uniref:uncharacterized protein n=1 Tax=Epargyreus clarus TaxID=520877 RepID=UPI003C2DBBF1
MTSRRIEDAHVEMLNKLLSETGLECIRSAPASLESSSTSGESEAHVPCEEEEHKQASEALHEEALLEELAEEVMEEQPEVFPTPSLRKMLPDTIRDIEAYNRIHVLPEEFKKDIDPLLIPKIAYTAQQKYIDILAELTGCKEYTRSLAEYWFLDTLANLLRRAQEDGMDRPSQAVLILWFCEWMKEMQNFDAADRQRMLKRFQDNMLSAAKYIAEEEHLPTPADIGVNYKTLEEVEDRTPASSPLSKHLVTFEGAAYECSLRDLTKIIHYIFDLFSSDYQYNLVRSVFTFAPEYVLIDAPYYIQNPKRMYAPLKPKKEKPAKKEAKPQQKGRKKEVDTEEYLALLELRAKEEREIEERDERDRENWNRRSHVLPLSFAVEDTFFDKYWPPPEPEPVPEPEPDHKPKGKGKK